MLKKLNKRRKGQNTAEYAILIALVVAAVIAMQTFVKRGLQGRMFDATKFMQNGTTIPGSTANNPLQYEPYYLSSDYKVEKDSKDYKKLDETTSMSNSISTVTKDAGGFKEEIYANTLEVGAGMD